VKLGINEKGEEEGCRERKVYILNKWWEIMTIYSKDNRKTCRRRNVRKQGKLYAFGRRLQRMNRRKRSKKLGRREGGCEKKIQRQGGNCRGEEIDGMDRRKKRSGTNKGTYIGSRGETVIDYGIVNEEAWERVEEFRIGEKVESDHLEIALKRRGGKEQRRKEVGDRKKIVNFFGISIYSYNKTDSLRNIFHSST
jgi:hypothetical protein